MKYARSNKIILIVWETNLYKAGQLFSFLYHLFGVDFVRFLWWKIHEKWNKVDVLNI